MVSYAVTFFVVKTSMTTNEISIRAATLADAPVIHEIYSFHVRHGTASWELEPPSLEEFQARLTKVLEQGYPYFVAELGETVVGYTFAGPFRPRPGYRYTVENSVYVHPDHQRRGLGRLMLAHLIKVCEELGYRQMIAVIGDSENTPSIRLHRELGFVHIGTFSGIGFKHNRWLDSVLMQRTLGDGNQRLPDGINASN